MNKSPTVYYDKELIIKRKDWDSNPGNSYPFTAFRVRPVRPLRHLSLVSQTNECLLTGYKSNNNLQINHPVKKIASLICRIVRRERTCGCRRAVYRAAVSVADRSIFSYLATLYDSVLQQWENFSINSGRGLPAGTFGRNTRCRRDFCGVGHDYEPYRQKKHQGEYAAYQDRAGEECHEAARGHGLYRR